MKYLHIVCLSVLAIVLSACGIVIDSEGAKFGNPRDFAEATHIARLSQEAAQATEQAVSVEATKQTASIRAEATRQEMVANATATSLAQRAAATGAALAQQAAATATAVPYQAQQVQSSAQTKVVRDWTWALALIPAIMVALLVALLMGMAWVAFVQTRAKVIPRGKDGQLPGILIGNTMMDPVRGLGPAVTAPSGWQVFARWTIGCLAERRLLPYPDAQPVQLTDGGADADHYLEAARVAAAVGVAAATFQPGIPERDRKGRLELITRQGDHLGLPAGAPMTRVVVQGDSAIEEIARALGDRLPAHQLAGGPAPTQRDQLQESPTVVEG